MDKRIKTLYIITIIAILSFLGMEAYWLYGRYEYALSEYGARLKDRIMVSIEEYNKLRDKEATDRSISDMAKPEGEVSVPSFSLSQSYGDSVETIRTSKILTYRYSAHQLLGLPPGTPLTDEDMNRVVDIVSSKQGVPTDSVVYDASGAKNENEAWNASKNVQLERKSPFTAIGLDSMLKRDGIRARVEIGKADSMMWDVKENFHKSIIRPRLALTVPYSQFEGQYVEVMAPVDPFDVIPGIWQTLIVSLIVSGILIACLIAQIATVLKLSRLDKMRNDFITTMIHELKRPLSTLKMCVSGLENDRMMQSPDLRREMLSETRTSLDNLSAYFSKLRDITFNDVEQIPLNIQRINLYDLCETVAGSVEYPASKSVSIYNRLDPGLDISADPAHMQNVMNNLMENAVKYSGEMVSIMISATEIEGGVEIRFRDDGNGISAADMKNIFRRFYRGKAAHGDQPGMGLGLAYVKLLIEAHGGEIRVESEEGKGTCFIIRLPQ